MPAVFEQIFAQFSMAESIRAGQVYNNLPPNPKLPASGRQPDVATFSGFSFVNWWRRCNEIADELAYVNVHRAAFAAGGEAWLAPIVLDAGRRRALLEGADLRPPFNQQRGTAKALTWQQMRTVWITPGAVANGRQFSITLNAQTRSYMATGSTVAEVTAGLTTAWNASPVDSVTATDKGTCVELRIPGMSNTAFASSGTYALSIAATGGGTIRRDWPTGCVQLPALFWGSSGPFQQRMTTPWSGNQTGANAAADWFVSGEGRPAPENIGVRIIDFPLCVPIQLPGGEWFKTWLWDGEVNGGWPGISMQQAKSAARAQWLSFLQGIRARWDSTGHPELRLRKVIMDTEWKRERFSLNDTNDYNWYTANPSYNPGTTWHADLIAKLDPTTGQYPTLAAELYLRNVPSINSWNPNSGTDTYYWNEGVRQLHAEFIKEVVVEPWREVMGSSDDEDDCDDYESTPKNPCLQIAQPVKRWSSPIGPGYTNGATSASRQCYGSTDGGIDTMNAWFAGVGECQCPKSPWTHMQHDWITLQSIFSATTLPAALWVCSTSAYTTFRDNPTNGFWHHVMMLLGCKNVRWWNSSPTESSDSEALLLAAMGYVDQVSEGKWCRGMAMPARGRWDVPTNRYQPIVQDFQMWDGLRILTLTLTRSDDNNFSGAITYRSNPRLTLAGGLGEKIKLQGARRLRAR